MRLCMYMHNGTGPDCMYMHSTAPACKRTTASDLHDLTTLATDLVPLCCHPLPEGAPFPGGHASSAPSLAAQFGGRLVDDPRLESEPVGQYLAHRAFGDLAAKRQHSNADQSLGRSPLAERLAEYGIGQLSVLAAEFRGSLAGRPVFRLGEAAGRDALLNEPRIGLGLRALPEVGIGDVRVGADVEPPRGPMASGRAAHGVPALIPFGHVGPRRDVLAEAFAGRQQACHPVSASPSAGVP